MEEEINRLIYIVEDDSFLREIATKKLSKHNYDVIGHNKGEDMLERLEADKNAEARKPDLFILDLMLPGMHGLEVLATIKGDEDYKAVPAIILSNLGQEEDIKKARELGAADYLVKAQFSFDDIITKIDEVLAHPERSPAL